MNELTKKVASGAISGFVSAFLIDLNAWSKSEGEDGEMEPFSWKLAIKRWVAGAASGAVAALGIVGL